MYQFDLLVEDFNLLFEGCRRIGSMRMMLAIEIHSDTGIGPGHSYSVPSSQARQTCCRRFRYSYFCQVPAPIGLCVRIDFRVTDEIIAEFADLAKELLRPSW